MSRLFNTKTKNELKQKPNVFTNFVQVIKIFSASKKKEGIN